MVNPAEVQNDVRRVAALLRMRDSANLPTRVAIEMRLKQVSSDVLGQATASIAGRRATSPPIPPRTTARLSPNARATIGDG